MTPTTSGQLTATCSRYSAPTPIRITVPAIAPAGCCETTQADSSAASPHSTATILSTATSLRWADAAFSNVSITNKLPNSFLSPQKKGFGHKGYTQCLSPLILETAHAGGGTREEGRGGEG